MSLFFCFIFCCSSHFSNNFVQSGITISFPSLIFCFFPSSFFSCYLCAFVSLMHIISSASFIFCFCFFENEKTILFYLLLLYFLDVPYFPITIGTLTIYDLGEVRNFVMVKCFSFNLSCE